MLRSAPCLLEDLGELFAAGVADVSATRHEYVFRYHSPAHFIDVFRRSYGPVLKAFEVLDDPGRAARERDL